MEIPNRIKETNLNLMLQSMDYFYDKLRVNKAESDEIAEWINQVRVDLKKNIIKKQNRDINNREIYAYLHDIPCWICLISGMRKKTKKQKMTNRKRKSRKRKRRVNRFALSCIGKRDEAS